MYKPTSPSLRFKRKISFTMLNKDYIKSLSFGKKSYAGRNLSGSIVVRHKQKGSFKNHILIDYRRRDINQIATCCKFVYDTNRSAITALIKYANGVYSYIVIPQGLYINDIIKSATYKKVIGREFNIGDSVFLRHMPIEFVFFNLELKQNKGAQYARAAGTYCKVIKEEREKQLHTLKLPTGAIVVVSSWCVVTLGKSSNPLHKKEVIGKAGINRKKGIRPTTRGVAMNPVDHPHGGRTKTSSPEVTPWGKIAKRNK